VGSPRSAHSHTDHTEDAIPERQFLAQTLDISPRAAYPGPAQDDLSTTGRTVIISGTDTLRSDRIGTVHRDRNARTRTRSFHLVAARTVNPGH